MGKFLFSRSHSRLRCLRLLPLRRRPTSCAKLSARARLDTVAPTLSLMPSGRPLSGANGAAEFASSAIALRRIDYWLKAALECLCEIVPSRATKVGCPHTVMPPLAKWRWLRRRAGGGHYLAHGGQQGCSDAH
jgi:hypothetical protein